MKDLNELFTDPKARETAEIILSNVPACLTATENYSASLAGIVANAWEVNFGKNGYSRQHIDEKLKAMEDYCLKEIMPALVNAGFVAMVRSPTGTLYTRSE